MKRMLKKKNISIGGLIFKNPKLFSWNHTHIQTKLKQIQSKNKQTTCKSMADSCQCMTKTTQYCKLISLQLIKINEKKLIAFGFHM